MPDSTTNFSQLLPEQIDKLRDAFQLIDQDNDGNISKADLKATYKSLKKDATEKEIKKMMGNYKEIGFPAYLSLMSEELGSLPNRGEIQRALQVFSHDTEFDMKELRKSLLTAGMSEEEMEPVLSQFKTERMNGDVVFVGSSFLNYVSS